MKIEIGMVVVTNYGTGPYVILHISRPCNCPNYLDTLRPKPWPESDIHYHFICKKPEDHPRADKYYLGGYRLDGTNVWDSDFLTVVDLYNVQTSLF